MCGLAGFVGEVDPETLRRMTAAVAHRGPDGEGCWLDETRGVHLGHRRLAIVDGPGGAQPMWTEDGALALVFNGEIYNHAVLRDELTKRGRRFRSDHSDTETLLYSLREWGPEAQTRLNGMWAFAAYDRVRGEIICGRDRFGQKPLYYAHGRGWFAFASDLRALTLHPAVGAEIDRQSLRKYFAYGYIPAPRSLYRGALKLPAGCWLRYRIADGDVAIHRYWTFELEPDPALAARDPEQLCQELRELMARAVSRRLMADTPVGVFLSGGVDSSAVAHFAARGSGESPRLFSMAFADASFDESRYARLMAARLPGGHAEDRLDWEKARAAAPRIVAGLDEPIGDSSVLPTALLAEFAARSVKLALGGDGADELFAGYDPFRALRRAELYRRLAPRPVHRAARLLAARLPVSHANMSLGFKINKTLQGLGHPPKLWAPAWMSPMESADLAELFREPVEPESLYAEALAVWDACRAESLVDKTLAFFTRLYLQEGILAKIDRAGMMFGLEIRSPFLDIELVDFARRLPARLKFRDGRGKWLLKRALAPLLPPEIIGRRKKGFGAPVGKWFHEGALTVGPVANLGLDAAFVERVADQHRRGKVDRRLFLWCLWTVQGVSGVRSPNGW